MQQTILDHSFSSSRTFGVLAEMSTRMRMDWKLKGILLPIVYWSDSAEYNFCIVSIRKQINIQVQELSDLDYVFENQAGFRLYLDFSL